MTDELWRLSACELADHIRQREFTCVEVMQSVLERIGANNPRLNAVVHLDADAALDGARAADAAIAARRPLGPLHGIPVTIKENIDVEGQATPNGLPAFKDLIAPADSPVTRNLRRAGAIIMGRTNTPELSMRADTDNPLRGRTFNPWDGQASAGGSSGGAGAAAAAGFGPIHHGNDIGGSLRFPSFCCGVTSVKPSFGRIPAFNPSATAERGMLAQLMSVQGAICREVRDVRLATGAMAKGDPRDPWWVPAPFAGWPASATPLKVALTKETNGYPAHDGILAALDQAALQLTDAGYQVEEVVTPSIMQAAQSWFDVAVSEIDQTLGPLARAHGSETINALFGYMKQIGQVVDAEGYRARIAERTAYTREWNIFLDQYPLLLTPFLMRPTYPADYDVKSADNTRDLFLASMYSCGVNYLALPAGVIATGLVAGLPAAVQVIGRRYREDLILDAMAAIEARSGVLAHTLWQREG
ncbi:MAG: amidase [Gammaproteobacteria bacterium]|nr:amidase [Gammaproteobacteria bacterium]